MAKQTKSRNAKYGQTKYPFATLLVGQHFEVVASKRFTVATLAKTYGDRHGYRFTVRKDPQDHADFLCTRVK